MATVNLELRDGIALVTIDNPPVNGLSAAMRTGLADHLDRCLADSSVGAIVLAGAGRMFGGGADIREFNTPFALQEPALPQLIDRFEAADKPVVIALHGVAAGGALELALGCHYRVAAKGTRLGLPEVTLGIVPGAGGTQRLPRLIGIEAALDMIVPGALIPAEKADRLGLVDLLVEDDAAAAALDYARSVLTEGRGIRRTSELNDHIEAAKSDSGIFDRYREKIVRRARGFEAPYACIECIEAAVTLPFADGRKFERETFKRCVESDQSKALRHAFFAERQAAKIADVPKDTPVAEIARAAVVGCGTMGGGIAMNFANSGIPVRVLETDRDRLDAGIDLIRKNYAATVSKGRLDQAEMDRRMGLIEGTADYADLGDVDIVIEAVFEEMDVKKEVLAKLDEATRPEAILTTNTSTLDVDEIARATHRPAKVMGTHFFSPANVMRLMENVRGAATDAETLATVMGLAKRIGKVGVLVGVCDGFVGNRMLYAYARQANFLLEEGALPQQIDKVIYDFGFPMGPFAMGDLAGLDVGWLVRKARAKIRPSNFRYSPIADRICEMGRFGQKTGAGWYLYEDGSRAPIPDPEIEALIAAVSEELGFERRQISDQEILERCLYPLINEGAKIVAEGIAQRPSDIDVIWLYGYGFPRYRGGPMFYADTIGVDRVYEAMSRLYDIHGDWLEPAPLLAELAKTGRKFGDI
ncbi:MAG: 3-hydroxyacyl-CoA dehydrogenase [Alphaproteobacteria bacterium]|nr:3-hydroxyacyl-CoA dehydrogenase [Alphaproteobacteria bacterium]